MPEQPTRRQQVGGACSRSGLLAWHRRAAADYRKRAIRDGNGRAVVFTDLARRHQATALMLQRDGKRRKAVARG